MYFFLKYIVTLFYKKLVTKIVVSLLRESGPWILNFPWNPRAECKDLSYWFNQVGKFVDKLVFVPLARFTQPRR